MTKWWSDGYKTQYSNTPFCRAPRLRIFEQLAFSATCCSLTGSWRLENISIGFGLVGLKLNDSGLQAEQF